MAQTTHHYSEREEWGLGEEILGQSMIETLQRKFQILSFNVRCQRTSVAPPSSWLITVQLFLFLLREDTVFSTRACEPGVHVYCSLL